MSYSNTDETAHRNHRLPPIREEGLPAAGLVRRAVGAIILLVGTLAIASLAVTSLVEIDITIDARGVLEPMTIWPVRSQETGLIRSVLVTGGDTVEQGTPMVRLDSLPLRTTLNQLQAQYEVMRLEHQRAKSAAPIERHREREQTAQASAHLVTSNATLRQKLVDFEFRGPVDSVLRAYSIGEHIGVDIALAEVMAAEAAVRSSIAQQELLALDELDLERQQTELWHLEQRIAIERERLERLTIAAPTTGVVLTEQLERLLGQYVRVGDLVLELAEPNRWRAILLLTERDVHRVEVGDRVLVEIAAFAGLQQNLIGGRIVSVALDAGSAGLDTAAPTSLKGIYRVIAELDEDEVAAIGIGKLKRGYSVQGKVITRTGRIIMLLWAYLTEKPDKR